MTRSPPWTPNENAALVALYFTMLDTATTGQRYNKAAMIRTARGNRTYHCMDAGTGYEGQLANRSKQSIEFKLMNASAAHAALEPDAVTMDGYGYRAMPNYQAALREAMQFELGHRAAARPLGFNHAVG